MKEQRVLKKKLRLSQLYELKVEMDARPVDSRILLGSNPTIFEAQIKFEPKNSQQTLF